MGENLPMIRQDEALMPTTYDGIMKQAQTLVKSGILPQEIKTPEAAVAIMLMGRELDIPPMQAFRSIYVVKGKPTLSAQLMGALILRAGHTYHVDELSEKGCAITFTRRGGLPYQHTFTIEEAKRAGLADSPTWRSYTKAMLFSRCMSAGARIAMPDVMAGMYTTEELSDPQMVTVDEVTGEVVASNAVIEGQAREIEDEPKSEKQEPHWSQRQEVLARFWPWTESIGLTHEEVHEALGVEHLREFAGTMVDAKAVITRYVSERASGEDA